MKQEERKKLLMRIIGAAQIASQSPLEIAETAVQISNTETTRRLLEDMERKFNDFQSSIEKLFDHLQDLEIN